MRENICVQPLVRYVSKINKGASIDAPLSDIMSRIYYSSLPQSSFAMR